eukprot:Phypoly_transcript_12299.p1 GENE.Phypoly_transcript_12299~~Phypoly_transcript_12299.p1  ORF type:complete len:324 (+),score=42.49 Phypoly_transcript_12299:151-1122(+)
MQAVASLCLLLLGHVWAYDVMTQVRLLKTIEDPYQGRNFSLGTNPHLQEIFVGRCYAVLGASPSFASSSRSSRSRSPSSKIHISNEKDPLAICTELWGLFSSAFHSKNDVDVLPSDFQPYFSHPAVLSTIDPAINKALFWSGVSDLIPTYQDATGDFVMEVSSLIEIVSDLMFCGSNSSPSGFDYKSCIYGDFNTTGDSQWHGTWVSYWAAASLAYAPTVSGNITILLRGAPSPYRRNSFFGSCELPNLPVHKITNVQVFVVPPEQGGMYDMCGEGSISELMSDLVRVGVNESVITCVDDPPLIRLIDCLHAPVTSQCLLNYL